MKCPICEKRVSKDLTVSTNLGTICDSCYDKNYDKIKGATWATFEVATIDDP